MKFHMASRYCYELLKGKPNTKEESITDNLLYIISHNNPKVIYKDFTRKEEALNGSDWEWWIITDSNTGTIAYRFRVQAKKLKPKGDNAKSVLYKQGKQMKSLIENSIKDGAMPIYAFYSCTQPVLREQVKHIDYINKRLLGICTNCVNSCFLSSAFRIKDFVMQHQLTICERKLLNRSFQLSILDELFIHNCFIKHLLLDVLDDLNKHYVKYASDISNSENTTIKYQEENIPVYVKELVNKSKNNDDISWYEQDFPHHFESLNGIGVIDLTDLNNS